MWRAHNANCKYTWLHFIVTHLFIIWRAVIPVRLMLVVSGKVHRYLHLSLTGLSRSRMEPSTSCLPVSSSSLRVRIDHPPSYPTLNKKVKLSLKPRDIGAVNLAHHVYGSAFGSWSNLLLLIYLLLKSGTTIPTAARWTRDIIFGHRF